MPQDNGRPRTTIDTDVLDTIRRRGTTTRVELARELGVTAATITNAVKRLLSAGLVMETGHAKSTGGKRASLLQLNDQSRWALGCTVDAGRLSLAAVDTTGALRSRSVQPLPANADRRVVEETLHRGVELMAPTTGPATIAGIGFSIPSSEHGADLAYVARKAVADLGLAAVDADEATCAAVGSYWSGEQPEHGVTATVHTDGRTTIALLEDGVPMRRSSAGLDLGLDHVCVDPHGPACPCGRRGCLQLYASPDALVAHAQTAGIAEEIGIRGNEDTVISDAVQLALAASRGEARARAILEDAAEATMHAVWPIVAGLGVGSVTLTGTIPQAAPATTAQVAATYSRTRTEALGCEVPVYVSQVQPHPCAVGAAVLALRTFLQAGTA